VEREHEVSQPPWQPSLPLTFIKELVSSFILLYLFFKNLEPKKRGKRNSADGSGGGRTRGKSAQASACSRNGRIHNEQKNRCVVPWVRSAGARQRTADERGGASKEST
jgi:hypothetical protein